MPLVGFKCEITGEEKDFKECFFCSLNGELPCPFPYSVLRGIYEEKREEEGISVTMLTHCIRSAYLTTKEDYYMKPSDLYHIFRGTLAHTLIASYAPPDSLVEEPFERPFNGLVLRGTPDLIIPSSKTLVDFKTCREVPKYSSPFSGHTEQLNLYKWLVEERYEIEKLEVVYLSMSQVKRMEVPIWDRSYLEEFLERNFLTLSEAFKKNVPPSLPIQAPFFYWKCSSYCPVNHICFNYFKEELKEELARGKEVLP